MGWTDNGLIFALGLNFVRIQAGNGLFSSQVWEVTKKKVSLAFAKIRQIGFWRAGNFEVMEWLVVLLPILIGAVLLILEFLVLSGSHVAGILGFAGMVAGIYFGYVFYGTPSGHLILLGSLLFIGALTGYVLRSDTWKKLSLDTRIDATVEAVDGSIQEGDRGETLGRLAPMGNVRIGGHVVEAESRSGYIDAHRKIRVVEVCRNKVVVETDGQA